jgi:hypothetical protein
MALFRRTVFFMHHRSIQVCGLLLLVEYLNTYGWCAHGESPVMCTVMCTVMHCEDKARGLQISGQDDEALLTHTVECVGLQRVFLTLTYSVLYHAIHCYTTTTDSGGNERQQGQSQRALLSLAASISSNVRYCCRLARWYPTIHNIEIDASFMLFQPNGKGYKEGQDGIQAEMWL